MSFGAELRDFANAFQAGYKMVKSGQEIADEKENRDWVREQRGFTREDRTIAASDRALRLKQEEEERPLRLEALRVGIDDKKLGMQATKVGMENTRSAIDARDLDTEIKRAEHSPNTTFQSGVGAIVAGDNPTPAPTATPAPEAAPQAIPVDRGDGYSFAPTPKPTPAQAAVTEMAAGKPGDYVAMGHDQVKDSLNLLVKESGVGTPQGVPTPESKMTQRQVLQGKFRPASAEDVQAVLNNVRKQLGESATDEEVGMKAFGAIREYYMKIGQPELGTKAAADLLQYYQSAYNKYAAIAAAAAQDGNTDAAVKAAVKAYGNIPDGKDMKAVKNKDGSYNVSFTDLNTGKTVERHILTPDQIGSLALKLGNPSTFSQAILSAAGQRKKDDEATPAFKTAMKELDGISEGGKLPQINASNMAAMDKDEQERYLKARTVINPAAEKQVTFEDRGRVQTQVGEAYQSAILDNAKIPPAAKEYLTTHGPEIQRVASNIMTNSANKNIIGQDAVETVVDMMKVNEENPGMPPGKIIKSDDTSVTIKVSGHPAVTMPIDDYNNIGKIWAQAANDRSKKIAEEGARAKAAARRSEAVTESWKNLAGGNSQDVRDALTVSRENMSRFGGGMAIPVP